MWKLYKMVLSRDSDALYTHIEIMMLRNGTHSKNRAITSSMNKTDTFLSKT